MKRVFSIALILIFGLSSLAVAVPKISVSEKSWDFGRVARNSTIRHGYLVKNVGDDTLRIERVKPG